MPRREGMKRTRHMAGRNRAASLIVVSALEHSLVGTVEVMAQEYGVRFLGALAKPLTAKKLRDVLGSHPSARRAPRPTPIPPPLTPGHAHQGPQPREFPPLSHP